MSLLHWQPDESDLTSKLVLELKGSRHRIAWNYYARMFFLRRLSGRLNSKDIVIVTPPITREGRIHAQLWGEALARQLGVLCCSPFSYAQGASEQKKSRRQERDRRHFRLNEEFTSLSKISTDTLWVFADDIVTSGATYRAAHAALGSPPHFEVWAFGQRGALLQSIEGSAITCE